MVIDQYEKEQGLELVAVAGSKFTKPNFWSLTPKTLIIGSSLLVALLAIVYIGIEIRSVLVPPYLTLSEPAPGIIVAGNSVRVARAGEIGPEVFLNNPPVLAYSPGTSQQNPLVSSPFNLIPL